MRKGKFSLTAQFIFRDLDEITPDFLKSHGVSLLMVDLDNTIASYDEHEPSKSVLQWFGELRKNDINPFMISNSTREERVIPFAKALGVSYIMYARKPSPNGLYRAMGMANVTPDASALIGDQVFTDALAANLAGVMPILVHPKKFTNPFLALRYLAELPFRRRVRRVRTATKQTRKETDDEHNNENSPETP